MKKVIIISFIIIVAGLILPQKFQMPVDGADEKSYNHKSFWYYPWGKSGTHKGVDIFANEGTTVTSATNGIVLYTGNIRMGGNIVLILGPKWRLHYYAHLKSVDTHALAWTSINEKIGRVGTTGNAKGKSPHLHYSITTLLPYPWRIDTDKQGWKKMFYLNPIEYLTCQNL